MVLSRVQLFEFNDAPWAPAPLRDQIIESLSLTLQWGRVLRELVPPFEDFLAQAAVTQLLDIAAGAGGPASILVNEIIRAGRVPPRFVLTDLQPKIEAWQRLRIRHPDCIDFCAEPIDATALPPRLSAGHGRLIINALHHLPPALVSGIFRDAVEQQAPLFIAEGFERDPRGFVSLFPAGTLAMLANPWLSQSDRLAKAWLTWATPATLLASLWDGVVSTLRIYSRADLEAFVAPLGGDYRWSYGHYRFPFGGRGYYFYGVPPQAR